MRSACDEDVEFVDVIGSDKIKFNPRSPVRTRLYYLRQTEVPFEEDSTHEFKAHMNLCAEEIPNLCKGGTAGGPRRSRQPVSRTIGSFLNSGKGGTIYLGIKDNGIVVGFNMSQTKKDHFMANLEDVMSRFRPPVRAHRYKVRFILVIDEDSTDQEIQQMLAFDSSTTVGYERRRRPHLVRDVKYCWCVKEHIALFNTGVVSPHYVIELVIKPWDSTDSRNAVGGTRASDVINLHPVHENEEGYVYVRHQASVKKYTMSEVCQMTKDEVKTIYEPAIERLKSELEKRHILSNFSN